MKNWKMWFLSVSFFLSMYCLAGIAAAGEKPGGSGLLPLEFKKIPVNGNDLVTDPAAVMGIHGFATRAAAKIVEHGDSITLLDTFSGLETPHINWAAPYANGPVKVLYICSQVGTTRNLIELTQRSGFDIDILQIPAAISDGDEKKAPVLHQYYADKFRKILSQDYDVIIMSTSWLFWHEQYGGGVKNVSVLGQVIQTVKNKVKNGSGLVILNNLWWWYRMEKDKLEVLNEMSPITQGYSRVSGIPERTKTDSPVTDAFSLALWPETASGKGKVDQDAKVLAVVENSPIIASGRYGKGRVAAFYYQVEMSAGLIPKFNPEKTPLFGDYYEPVYALYLKTIAWAAGKAPRITLRVPAISECKAGEKPKVKLEISGKQNAPESVTLKYCLVDSLGNISHERNQQISLKNGADEVVPDLPSCDANGLYKLYIWLKNNGKIENWGCAAIRVTGGIEFAVAPQSGEGADKRKNYLVETSGISGKLKITAIDDMDRIFFHKSVAINDGDKVSVDFARSGTPRNRIYFSFYDPQERLIGRKAVFLYVPRIGLKSLEDEFVIASYDSAFAEQHLNRFMGALYRAAGFNTYYGNWHNRYFTRTRAADKGLFNISGAFAPVMKQWKLEKKLNPCPNNPEVRKQWREQINQAIDDIKTYGGIGRVINDENYFAITQYQDGETQGAQACQCEYCMKKFRQAMKTKYRKIARLNEAWSTDFKDFDSIKAIEEHEIKEKHNTSGWLEFRQYMNWTYANQYYKWIDEQHRPLGTDYRIGAGAPYWTSREGGPTYKGGDYTYLKKVMRFMMAYGGPEAAIFDKAYVGQPGGQKFDPPLEWRQHGSWYHLLNGADALWYFKGQAIIGNELAFRRQAEWTLEGIRDIQNGMGVLVSRATPLNKQVRLFYSPENLAMAWLFAKHKDDYNTFALEQGIPVSEATFRKLFRDFNLFQPSYITAGEIKQRGLKDCKLLILSQALNISSDTAAAIKEYVKEGGTVVADVMPGTRSLLGRRRKESILSDLFGVDASGMELHKESKVWYSVGVGYYEGKDNWPGENTWLPADTTFIGLKPTTARIGGKMLSRSGKESPACLLNNYGKGKTLLLNFIYRDLNLETCDWHKRFGAVIIKWASLNAPAKIIDPLTKSPLPYRPLYAFKYGKATLLGSIRGRMVWSGGRPILIDEGRSLSVNDKALFTWQEKRHIYNVRKGKYLGFGNSVEIDLPSYCGKLLALLPYQVTEIQIQGPDVAKVGEILRLKVKILTDHGAAQDHVLRMNVYSPTGYHNLLYSKTVTAESDTASLDIPFADNDRSGNWTIVINDVLSGVKSRKDVTVK